MHSNWTLKLWTDENIKDLNFDNRDIFDKADNYGMKSDILRYEILYREGGIYIDIDYECLQSIENIINWVKITYKYQSFQSTPLAQRKAVFCL